MTPTKRRGAGAAAAERRPQRLALSSISASDANTPRQSGGADVRAKLARTGVIDTSAKQHADDEATATKLWNMLPGACEYSVADSPHLKLLYPPDGAGVCTPRAAESSSPVPTETTPQPVDLSHVPMMKHRATGFPNAAATHSQLVQPADSPHVTADMLTPDARLQRRRKALASGSFKDGAGALFSNTAHLDLELLDAPTAAPPPHFIAGSHPVGGMLGMAGCVLLGALLQPILFMAWPQTVAPLPVVGSPEEAITQLEAAPTPSDWHPTPPQWVAPHVDVSEVCPVPVDAKVKPAQLVSHRYDSTPLWNPLSIERQVVQAAAHEWSLLELSRLSTRLSQAEQERDLLRQKMTENIGTLKTVVAMEMAEHRARVALEQDVHWLEAELAALVQSEQESWCVGQACGNAVLSYVVLCCDQF